MSQGYPDYTLDVSGTVQVNQGGTGNTSFPAYSLLLGNGTQPLVWQSLAGGLGINCIDPVGGIELAVEQGGPESYAYFQLNDGTSGKLIYLAMSLYANVLGLGDAIDDFAIICPARFIIAAEGATSPQVVIDSGGIQLPAIESLGGFSTTGIGAAAVMADHGWSGLTGSTSYTETLLASAPSGRYFVGAWLYQTASGGTGNMSVSVGYEYTATALTQLVAPAVASGALHAVTGGSTYFDQNVTGNITVTATTNNSTGTFFLQASLLKVA